MMTANVSCAIGVFLGLLVVAFAAKGCKDKLATCNNIIAESPDFCDTAGMFSRNKCMESCGFCGKGRWLSSDETKTTSALPTTIAAEEITTDSQLKRTCKRKYQNFYLANHTACISRSSKLISAVGVTDKDKALIVDKHNEIRAKVKSAGKMLKMYWDDEIAMIAQHWAENCEFEHDEARSIPGRYHLGQNLALNNDWPSTLNDWIKEAMVYTEGVPFTFGNIKKFGHYTQMVWDTSTLIGCGEAVCEGLGSLFVCNYGPGGNIRPKGDTFVPYSMAKQQGKHCPRRKNKQGLCDCGGKVCYNGGTLDPNTCKCSCIKGLKYNPRDNCKLYCSNVRDPDHCLRSPFYNNCGTFIDVLYECPFMCKACYWAGEDYGKTGPKRVDTDRASVNNVATTAYQSWVLFCFLLSCSMALPWEVASRLIVSSGQRILIAE